MVVPSSPGAINPWKRIPYHLPSFLLLTLLVTSLLSFLLFCPSFSPKKIFCDSIANPKCEMIWTVTIGLFTLDIKPISATNGIGPFILTMKVKQNYDWWWRMTAHSSLLSNGKLTEPLLFFVLVCMWTQVPSQVCYLRERWKKIKRILKDSKKCKTEMVKYKDSHH